MKLEKPIKLYVPNNGKGFEELVKEDDNKVIYLVKCGNLDNCQWKRDPRQIFLFIAEEMADTLPTEYSQRLMNEALSLFPSNTFFDDEDYTLPIGTKLSEEGTQGDAKIRQQCKENKIASKSTIYGEIYINKPYSYSQTSKDFSLSSRYIEVVKNRYVDMWRLAVREKAWELSREPNGMNDAIHLLDWFNEFSSSFMAETGKYVSALSEEELNTQINLLELGAKEITKKYKERFKDIERREQKIKNNKDIEKRNKFLDKPKWVQYLCGEDNNEKVLNYYLDEDNNLRFSFVEPKYNFAKLGRRIVKDYKLYKDEYNLPIEKKGLQKILRDELIDYIDADIANPVEVTAKTIRKTLKTKQ